MEKGFYNSSIDYWQAVGGEPKIQDYSEGVIEVPLKPGANHVWQGDEWVM